MKSRINRVLGRAKYAAIFAAIGAGIGGLFSRGTASTGAAAGALIGASIGEKRAATGSISDRVKKKSTSASSTSGRNIGTSQVSVWR